MLSDSNLQPGFIPFRKDVNWNFTKVRCPSSHQIKMLVSQFAQSACEQTAVGYRVNTCAQFLVVDGKCVKRYESVTEPAAIAKDIEAYLQA